MSRIYQICGRVNRLKSHAQLPNDKRNFDVNILIASTKSGESVDSYIYNISLRKEKLYNGFLYAIRNVAISLPTTLYNIQSGDVDLFDFHYEEKNININSLKKNQFVLMAEIIKTKKYYIKLFDYLDKDIIGNEEEDDNIYYQMIIEIDNKNNIITNKYMDVDCIDVYSYKNYIDSTITNQEKNLFGKIEEINIIGKIFKTDSGFQYFNIESL